MGQNQTMHCSKDSFIRSLFDHCVGLCEHAYRQNEDVMAFTARAFRTSLVCRTVRSNNEPRSNPPLTGNLLTSFWRARRSAHESFTKLTQRPQTA
jgi:hypothetical protein